MRTKRLYLSPPDAGPRERELLLDAFDSNWLAPLGPHVDAFEREISTVTGVEHCLALSSGTAALHLALVLYGIGPGDEVLLPTLTFAATANAVRYTGATPVFVDCRRDTWTLDPDLLDEELTAARRANRRIRAVITVDIYGQCCDYSRIAEICERHDVPLIEDAAEALGATCGDKPAGSFGSLAVISFNGNKIITTSGGGMLLGQDARLIARARHLSTQAREPAPHYEHREIGYNYRMSNLLAAVGRGQLETLDARVARRRAHNQGYREHLARLPGVTFMPEASYGRCTFWLTCLLLEPEVFGRDREQIRLHLDTRLIEARPVWKPMHLQPVFADCRCVGGSVAQGLFEIGLCLPSGSSMTDHERDEVIGHILEARRE
ncbi:MAG: aminotransferase class I/II-fold pyridoxal phosphate-dependent enzyme [Myxococcota bacterium]